MTQQVPAINIVNNNGFLKFDGDGVYRCESSIYKINSRGLYRMEADDDILFKNTSGNLDIVSDHGVIQLNSDLNSSNAIILNASNTVGGIVGLAGSGGMSFTTNNGNIGFLAQGSNINIGVSPVGTPAGEQTQNINIESFDNLTMNSGDMYFVSGDVISFISNTGDIEFGTTPGGVPIIKFQNGNLLVNQNSSDLDRQVDIAVTHESISKHGHNGLVVNTFMNDVASDFTLQTSNTISDTQCILSMGSYPGNCPQANFQSYLGYQNGDTIIRLDGPSYSPNRSNQGFGKDFTYADIGKQIYWTTTERLDTIQSLGTLITGISDTSNLTVSGTYTGETSRVYLIQIDSIGTPNTFMWSNDGGVSFNQTYVQVSTSNIPLDNGIEIAFATTTGFFLYQQMTFQTKIIAYVLNATSIPNPEVFYTLQPFHSYLGTETPSDLVIKTANAEKMRITGDGAIGIQRKQPTACLDLDSNYNKILLVNQVSSGYQINPSITNLNSGGYAIVWNNQILTEPEPSFDVYGQLYLTDGTRYGSNFKVNNTTTNYQSFPFVANQKIKDSQYYSVVWASNSSPTFNVYAQVYNNNIPNYNFDILVGTGGLSSTLNNQLYPKVEGLYNGNYIIAWASDEDNTGITTIQGRIMYSNGNFITSKFQISPIGALTSRNYPYIAGLPSNDPYAPNGFVVGYMVKLDTDPDSRYTISISIFNEDGTPYSNEIAITSIGDGSLDYSSISDGLVSLSEINLNLVNPNAVNGGFVISFYRNYQADTTLYNVNDNVLGSTSGASALIDTTDPVNRIIYLKYISNRFLVGEEIAISSTVPNVFNPVEKIAAITFTSINTGYITLDTGYRSVVAYKYNSNVSVNTDAIWTVEVNTTTLYQDLDRFNVPNNSTVFEYKRPLAAITVDNLGTALVSWSNGSIPSVYYQLLSVDDGSFIGTEMRLTSQYDGLKQRDQVVAHLQSIGGNDFGFVIAWDNQDLDLSQAGVYQQLIGYQHNIINFEDGNNKVAFNHAGQFSIGTNNPAATLHIQTSTTPDWNDPANPATITLQNTAQHIITKSSQQEINFVTGNNSVIGSIYVSNALRYDDLNPLGENLIGFYKFDETVGTQVRDSSGSSSYSDSVITNYINTNGILVNFDMENCWQPGLINNCLAFDGVSNYLFVQNTATNALNTVLETSKKMSISVWVKVPTTLTPGAVYDIISNGGNQSIAGTYILSLIEFDSTMIASAIIITDGALPSTIEIYNPIAYDNPLNDDKWHLITLTVFADTNGFINLFIDSNLISSTPIAYDIANVQHASATTYIGSCDSVNNFYRGYMDELRIYNNVLSQPDITTLYKYGSRDLGIIIMNADGTNNPNSGLVIDDAGNLNNFGSKPLPLSVLSGTITVNINSIVLFGNDTFFTQELTVGDIIVLDTAIGTEYTVIAITNDIVAYINLAPYNGPNANKSYQSVLRKPSIYTFFDNNDAIMGHIDNHGNMMIGNSKPSTLLEVSGVSDFVYRIPELTITNQSNQDLPFARMTGINFRGYNAIAPALGPVNLGRVAVSHYTGDTNPSADNRGIMQIFVNDGSGQQNVMSLVAGGKIGIGNQNDPLTQIHMIERTSECNLLMQSGYNVNPIDTSVFDEQSNLYFAGCTSISETISTNINKRVLASVSGSNDSNIHNLDGRLDFYTNNQTDNDNGIESRVSITRSGKLGVSILQPVNLMQVAPECRAAITNNINTIFSVLANTTIQVSNSIFSGYATANAKSILVGGTVVVGAPNLFTCKIVSIVNNNTMVVDSDLYGYDGVNIYVHLAGLNVSPFSNFNRFGGFVGINTTSPKSMLTVNGSFAVPIKTITGNYNMNEDEMLHTILGNTTGSSITITLPTTDSHLTGRLYTFKNIGTNAFIVVTPDAALIDGLNDYTLSPVVAPISSVVKLQSDGSNWWVL